MTQPFIPYGRQDIQPEDIDAVIAVLQSDFLTQGPLIPRFEDALIAVAGAKYAVAMNSGTSALHVACAALGLGPGDWLWTVPNSFVASANCGLYCGASVDFVDIDRQTRNMSVEALAAKLERAAAEKKLPKVVVPVHFGGQSCDMRAIKSLADRYDFYLVEDASHAIGGTFDGQPIGNCRFSDVTVFSFHPVKAVTTAEGGAAMTNDLELAERMAMLRTHGISRAPEVMEGPSEGPWYYQMLALGWNYRLTDVQAALGLSQIKRLSEYVRRRTELADRYDRLLAGSGLTLPQRISASASAWHLYVIGWTPPASGLSRRDAFVRLRQAGIGVNVHYIPIHLQPVYRRLGFAPGQFQNAEDYYATAITLPLHQRMTDAEQDRVVEQVMGLRRAAA